MNIHTIRAIYHFEMARRALPQPSRSSSASMLCFLVLTAVTFSLFGFILGRADGFEQVMPLLIITPLTFLGGSFYSIGMLPPIWQ